MTIPRVIGPIAFAAMALATLPQLRAQSTPGTENAAKSTKPLVIVARQIDGKSYKSNGNWHRIEVEVKAQAEALKEALVAQGAKKEFVSPVRWLNNVKVTLVVGYTPSGADLGKPKVYQDFLKLKDASAGGDKALAEAKNPKLAENWRYFKASTTVLTLEANTPKSVFFYIPADIVKRDDILSPRPDVAFVTMDVDGQEVPVLNERGDLHAGTFGVLFGPSAGKINKAAVDKFGEIADRASRETNGVMRPQNLITGFIDPDWKNSPEFLREEASK